MSIGRLILLAAAGSVGSFTAQAQTSTTNIPPSVAIVTPTNNASFAPLADIFIMANAIDRDGQVVEVSFYANEFYIGGVTNPPPDLSPLPPWRITWQGVPSGLYSLQARATDNSGARSWSAPVKIEVLRPILPPPLPVVSVIADDADAAEGGTTSWPNGGSFLFTRAGSTTDALTIYFRIGGTAENGVDYQRIGESVIFPPGAALTRVYVRPLEDTLVEPTETVTVRIDAPICATVLPPPPGCYAVGPSNFSATVYIRDAETTSNSPPVVRIFSPTNDASFAEGIDIRICAEAVDHTRYVDTVEFFAGDKSLGIATNDLSTRPFAGFCVAWSNAPAGNYLLTAKASDNFGLSATSPPVRITVGGPPPPTNQIVVKIEAVDSIASEQDPRLDIPTDPALLLVRRHGPTNVALLVQYRVGGSASNGVDYDKLSGEVAIPAGATTAEIFINAIDDALVEGTESVIVTIVPPVCPAIYPPPPECYTVGRADTAIAYIRDNDFVPSNLPPAVRITAPVNGTVFREGSDIQIEAVTVDRDGYAPMVEFFANGRKIGEQVINFIQAPPDGTPIQFSFTWLNVAAGFYTLTTRATDNEGATALSTPVEIKVGTNQPPPPPTNVVISIVALDSFASEGPWTNSSTYPTTTRGTNTAEFAVRRAGPTNDPVTVRYHVGGTASNGVDYAVLSGEVVIPAGSRIARILVVPIEDKLVEGIETIVLELMRSASDLYAVGLPNRAAAIITDNDSPRPPCLCLPGGLFHICLPGTNGTPYRLEGSTDLTNWVELCTSTVADGAIHFVDPDTAALPYRFYRAAAEGSIEAY